MKRRNFIKAATVSTVGAFMPFNRMDAETQQVRNLPVRTKICLNVYSFNAPLLAGEMTLDDVLEYAAQLGFEGVDLTGYYFPGYPQPPTDEYIYHIKHKAFSLGLEICGTLVRNNFSQADPVALETSMKLVKNWIEVTSKLGGQTMRVFSGSDVPAGQSREEVFQRIVRCMKECAEYSSKHGVLLAIQNSNDFLKTAAQVLELLKAVDSRWAGLMIDIDSYRSADPYEEIKQTVKYAITWQLKEEVYINGVATKTDFDKLKQIIDNSGFRGYLPIETLGEGDPKQKITAMYKEVKKRFG